MKDVVDESENNFIQKTYKHLKKHVLEKGSLEIEAVVEDLDEVRSPLLPYGDVSSEKTVADKRQIQLFLLPSEIERIGKSGQLRM